MGSNARGNRKVGEGGGGGGGRREKGVVRSGVVQPVRIPAGNITVTNFHRGQNPLGGEGLPYERDGDDRCLGVQGKTPYESHPAPPPPRQKPRTS